MDGESVARGREVNLPLRRAAPSHFPLSDMNKMKLADKPGSVVDSHSSRRFVT
jgi:hypothetical protein